MRKIIFDVETTGFDKKNDRIIEIGAVELIDYSKTGRTFQSFISPGKVKVSSGALKVHGITDEFLRDKPSFSSIFNDFWEFFNEQDAKLIAHNAKFDVGFINAELQRIKKDPLNQTRIIDTLTIAKSKHPFSKNDLNSLCKRYGVNITNRQKHGALLDSHLLADVYIKMMIGELQIDFGFRKDKDLYSVKEENIIEDVSLLKREINLSSRITKEELEKHRNTIKILGKESVWNKYIL